MKQKTDITTPEDIKNLITRFYEKATKDDLLSMYFTETNWNKHLPIMYAFWENIAFSSSNYNGNPMEHHRHINKIHPISDIHFKRWLKLFTSSIDELFEGDTCELIKERARSIGKIMLVSMVH